LQSYSPDEDPEAQIDCVTSSRSYKKLGFNVSLWPIFSFSFIVSLFFSVYYMCGWPLTPAIPTYLQSSCARIHSVTMAPAPSFFPLFTGIIPHSLV
jgi:hypothetical protein